MLSRSFILIAALAVVQVANAEYQRIKFTGEDNMCLEPGSGTYAFQVHLAECNNDDIQKWEYIWVNNYKEWRNVGRNLCMSLVPEDDYDRSKNNYATLTKCATVNVPYMKFQTKSKLIARDVGQCLGPCPEPDEMNCLCGREDPRLDPGVKDPSEVVVVVEGDDGEQVEVENLLVAADEDGLLVVDGDADVLVLDGADGNDGTQVTDDEEEEDEDDEGRRRTVVVIDPFEDVFSWCLASGPDTSSYYNNAFVVETFEEIEISEPTETESGTTTVVITITEAPTTTQPVEATNEVTVTQVIIQTEVVTTTETEIQGGATDFVTSSFFSQGPVETFFSTSLFTAPVETFFSSFSSVGEPVTFFSSFSTFGFSQGPTQFFTQAGETQFFTQAGETQFFTQVGETQFFTGETSFFTFPATEETFDPFGRK
ncbi:hypothetical protein SARC_02061 [Sphaeroforma arctica JP610]|uniref:Uncharacterized protein n=1 Tax=Sphaeroforma arctica JP610 TaxID=667725 RepID=A0A0L0G9P8_9EUKA|nr:hypothetical protein SARC_02061 [Sphaeroforma arctica JP610]KNC85757.1 hypothetical protein SARC_02061 [Sphaeroforma arctica JP610]|eukprot:XP_014159659.1 hypothetical protein SARC_02061 [Sphaeroforma arctica JP610]